MMSLKAEEGRPIEYRKKEYNIDKESEFRKGLFYGVVTTSKSVGNKGDVPFDVYIIEDLETKELRTYSVSSLRIRFI